ncbi:Putative Potential DNA binding protein [Rhizopus microsporus]|nr:Putative Potential DNA binding protein [Rhizopus microsporus]
MINGTKLLNVVGMSRGKRDGILKNEKGRVVVKVGAMHLKGVWITFSRAKDLATKFRIFDILYPLFVEDPSIFLSIPPPPPSSSSTTAPTNTNLPFMLPSKGYYKNDYQLQQWGKPPQQHYLPSINQEMTMRALSPTENHNHNNHHHHHDNHNPENGSMYLINHPHDYRLNRNQPPYHVHDNPSHFTPVYQRRSLMDGKEESEEQRQIGFPSSPPPEVKYYNNNNTFGKYKYLYIDHHINISTGPSSSSSSSQPEEQGKSSRKRASTIMNNNPKRIRSDKEFY